MKKEIKLKYFIKFALLLAIVILSNCSENENLNTNLLSGKKLNSRSVISEEYVYEGVHYILYFNSDDTSSIPNNESTADSLIDAIGDTEFILAYDIEYPNITFIEEPRESSDPDTTLGTPIPNGCLFAEFFEHINYGGASFCVDLGFTDYQTKFETGTSNLCAEWFGNPNLGMRNFPGGGNWANKISSFKMYGDGESKDWYDNNGYAGKKVFFYLFRDPGYYFFPNKYKYWAMTIGQFGDDVASWNVPNLRKERWGFLGLGGNFNDTVESIVMTLCKCSNVNYCFVN